jgi:uncharacterized protein (DUF58 family)
MSIEAVNLEAIGSTLARLERLPIAQKPLRGVLYGDYLTTQVGEGFDLHDLRPYEAGDDFRDINWPATLRSPDNELIVEDHVAENAPAFYSVSDIPSRRYFNDVPERNERQLGLGLAIVTTLMARRDGLPTTAMWSNGNRIGYGEEPNFDETSLVEGFKQAVDLLKRADELATDQSQRTKRGFFGLGRQKEANRQPERQIKLKDLLKRAGDIALYDSVIVVTSDFRDAFDPADKQEGWARPFAGLAERHHVTAVELTNKWDHELPEGEVLFTDPSTGKIISLDDIPNGRERYAEQEKERTERIAATIRRSGAQHLRIDTGVEDWVKHLEQQMEKLRQAA